MISEDSDLYREHPDWALKIPGRAMNRSRHQLNLDITRKEVREHIMNQIFKVLDACKADYVKWDKMCIRDSKEHVETTNKGGCI